MLPWTELIPTALLPGAAGAAVLPPQGQPGCRPLRHNGFTLLQAAPFHLFTPHPFGALLLVGYSTAPGWLHTHSIYGNAKHSQTG